MHILLVMFHITVCVVLVFVVLVQSSKGSQMGAAFGGSSQTVFGARGAATFLAKLTTTAAVIFMLSSFLLAFMETRRESIVKPTHRQAPSGAPTSDKHLPSGQMGVVPQGGKPGAPGKSEKSETGGPKTEPLNVIPEKPTGSMPAKGVGKVPQSAGKPAQEKK